MKPLFLIGKKNQRRPPPSELLQALGPPYDAWEVHEGPFGISVLRYPYIEGTSEKPTVNGWLKILEQVKSMHGINYVHGDVLPRNVIFKDDDEGYVIDFDLSRLEGSPYVQGFNYISFQGFRHSDAREHRPMEKEHDIHSLHEMSKLFFDLESHIIEDYAMDKLIQFFEDNPELATKACSDWDKGATGSPLRLGY